MAEHKEIRAFEIVLVDFDEDEPDNPDTQEWSIRCPWCGEHDTIVEVDRAIRWNEITLEGKDEDGNWEASASTGDGDWHRKGFRCRSCLSPFITDPEGFDIVEWS